ncbi:chromosome segregation protein SMC [Periweissella fabalis]|uniref:Chromosome partition protein Smc n=1 Tax=Periweissella fabalis TaxID=1070421 RepID=A0A7X6N626_9LACO|nr:chromosome segregation protein SMC [Periweissella fabalis]MCM0598718.1 chromosome segregation protein SMC [Periweissella fabalis]NKZ24683.1 chromosome segregation protein SMC [Periweissella fabalis]
MKLKSLEISGFKSFADKTKIEFKPGMTGIVGPNGSGKSNVIEAIRWVMGEQSAKGLRGEKMQDVIFGGTSKRSPLNRAEVTIVFDNSDHYLKTDFTEIRISRRLYRSGESNYLINGQDVRLRDIVELFMDTGLGRESFSIISQGRVEAIFNSKAEDRRTIIEEVAGVYKYKQNKERAQKELKQTQENLDRVEDILQEVASRIEPLSQQAAIAQDYLGQKQRYDALEKSRLVIEIDEYSTVQANNANKADQLKTIIDKQQKDVNHKLQQLKQLKQSQQLLHQRRDQIQAKLVTLAQTTERLNGLQNITAEREQTRTSSIKELTNSLQETALSLKQAENDLKNKKAELSNQQAKIKQVETELADLSEQTVTSRIEQLQAEVAKTEAAHLAELKLQVTVQNEVQNAVNNLKQVTNNGTDVQAQLTAIKDKLAHAQAEQKTLEQQLVHAQTEQQKVQTEFENVTAAYQVAHNQQKQHRQAWLDGLAVAKQAQARLESLQAMDNEYTGYYQGVRNLMRHREKFPEIAGTVADLLNVPAEFSKAIEVALGSALQQVVVANEQVAKNAVQFLTKQRLGRVTFLPINVIKGRSLSAQQLGLITNIEGFQGVASDLVTCGNKYSKILTHLLGTTVIASDLDSATTIAQAGQHHFKIVTIDGQIINPGGSITGGAQRNDNNGVLQQKTEIEQLTQAVATMKVELAKSEATVQDFERQVGELTEMGTAKRSELAICNENAQILISKVKLANENEQHLQQQVHQLLQQQQSFDDNINNLTQTGTDNKVRLTTIEENISKLQTKIVLAKDEINKLSQSQNALSEQIFAKREWLAGQRATGTALMNDITSLKQQVAQLYKNQQQLEQRLALFSAGGDELEQARERAQRELVVAQQDYQQATRDLATIKDELGQIEIAIQSLEQQLEHLQSTQSLSQQELSTLNSQLARNSALLEQAQQQLTEEYDLTIEAAKLELVNMPIDEIKTQLKLIKRGLDELGDVNLNSITEYQEVSNRHEFLSKQQADLIAARDNLFTTMAEMDNEVSKRFETTFNAVAGQFNDIFGRMFGGGKAELRLTDPSNLLTTGIDIMAQPPGKKFQQMSLLSGGEKALTAITLLFSILAVRPVPFAILDETEAALDDANVTRFAQYLHTFENDTQFIVITHRKGTMVNADMLYGITMQESGISKLVAVNLADIKQ